MLSILIPSYNFDIRQLVYDLKKQASNCKINYEIIIIDDKSNEDFKLINSELKKISKVKYIELEKNIGRSKIRNLLSEKSKYEYLIFMDCDSKVMDNNYIKNYLPFCKNETLVYGGREYENLPPKNKDLFFRWYYGTKREVQNSEQRLKNPNKSFMTNNFLISKNIFEKIKFDETINTYGHEDTIFGYDLKKKNISITHINNPLIHIGLETQSEFLHKTRQGIKNLIYISHKYSLEKELFTDIKILKYYKLIKKLRIKFIFVLFFKIFKKLLLKNLSGKKPSMLFFDLYKLGFLANYK